MAPLHLIGFIALSLACSLSATQAKKVAKPLDKNMINFQTGIDLGSTFAGGMTYDKTHNRLFLTGGTYARGFFLPAANAYNIHGEMNSDCFFAAIQLVNTTSDETSMAQWKQPTRLGFVKDPEACSTAYYLENQDRVFLGASASGASMGRTDIEGDNLPQLEDVSLFGEVISLSLEHVYNIAPVIPQYYIFGGHGFYQSEVNFPFAITSALKPRNAAGESTSDEQEESIYVASLYSKYGGQWAEDIHADEIDLSNPYIDGNVWGIAIQKIIINRSNATNTVSILENAPHMKRAWMKNLETTNFQKLQATSMVFVNDKLLLAGSTYDIGEQFAGEERKYHNYQDYDGFLVKIDPESGEIMESKNSTEKMKLRIQSNAEADDIIRGICLHPTIDEEGYVPYVYVVGSTEGRMDESGDFSGGGFVMQIDLFTMEVVWKDEIHGVNIEATDCAVTDDGQWIYVTGNARDGGVLPGWKSNGGDDLWVRQYGAISGEARWEIQMGSAEDETLAQGGAIVIDSASNAIIYGNTRGSMGRKRAEDLERPDSTNDIFIMTVTFDGGYLAPDPNPIFQIPRYYFGESGTSHRVLIGCMFLLTVILFCALIGTEIEWKPVNLKDYLSDLLPMPKKEKTVSGGESKALTIEKVAYQPDLTETEESEEEEENFVLYETGKRNVPSWQASYAPPGQPFDVHRSKRGGFEEEKTEIV
jgi:hypothetical protein